MSWAQRSNSASTTPATPQQAHRRAAEEGGGGGGGVSRGGAPMNILAFGDSLTEGAYGSGYKFHPYSERLQQLLDGAGIAAKVHSSGRSGERVTPSMMERLPRELQRHEQAGVTFDWVLILAGINDIGYGAGPQTVFNGLKHLYHACNQHKARVLAMTLMETDSDRGPWLEARTKVNELLRALPANEPDGYGHVAVMDLEREMPLHALTAAERQELWADGLHLTPQGYDRMAERIFNALQPLLQQQPNSNSNAARQ